MRARLRARMRVFSLRLSSTAETLWAERNVWAAPALPAGWKAFGGVAEGSCTECYEALRGRAEFIICKCVCATCLPPPLLRRKPRRTSTVRRRVRRTLSSTSTQTSRHMQDSPQTNLQKHDATVHARNMHFCSSVFLLVHALVFLLI